MYSERHQILSVYSKRTCTGDGYMCLKYLTTPVETGGEEGREVTALQLQGSLNF